MRKSRRPLNTRGDYGSGKQEEKKCMKEKHGGGKETSSLVQKIGHRVLIRKTVARKAALPEKPEVGVETISMAHILSISDQISTGSDRYYRGSLTMPTGMWNRHDRLLNFDRSLPVLAVAVSVAQNRRSRFKLQVTGFGISEISSLMQPHAVH
jgi:hypothetical protein